MVSEHACMFVTYPGTAVLDALDTVTSNWLEIGLILAAVTLLVVIGYVIASIELFELVPILSVIADWLELLLTEPGMLLFLYVLFSILTAVQLIPICGSVL